MHAPPVNRMTDDCENITLPQTSFAGGNKLYGIQCTSLHGATRTLNPKQPVSCQN